MAEEAGTSGGKRESIFTRRPGSRCLSTLTEEDKKGSTEGDIFFTNPFFNPKRTTVRTNGFTDFESDFKPPRPFYRHDEKVDAFDIQDRNAPADVSVDIPTLDFIRLAKQATTLMIPRNELTPIVEGGGVRKRILLDGLSKDPKDGNGPALITTVTDGCRVWIHYEMYVDQGENLKPLDSTVHHRLATSLEVGLDGLLGLYHAVKSMRKKEIAEVFMEPEFAYGKRGIPYFIAGNQCLRVIIQLVDISNKTRQSAAFMNQIERRNMELSLEEIFEDVEKLVKAGNIKFGQELYRDACDRYNWALDMLQEFRGDRQSQFTPEDEAIDQKSYQLYSNLALCYNRVQDYEETDKVCKAALALVHSKWELKPKVLYRYATAMYHLKKFNEAEKLCTRGLRCHMGGNEFQNLMQLVKIGKVANEQAQEESESEPESSPEPFGLDLSIENDLEDDNEAWVLPGVIKTPNYSKLNQTG